MRYFNSKMEFSKFFQNVFKKIWQKLYKKLQKKFFKQTVRTPLTVALFLSRQIKAQLLNIRLFNSKMKFWQFLTKIRFLFKQKIFFFKKFTCKKIKIQKFWTFFKKYYWQKSIFHRQDDSMCSEMCVSATQWWKIDKCIFLYHL